jgi:hypothetical protein
VTTKMRFLKMQIHALMCYISIVSIGIILAYTTFTKENIKDLPTSLLLIRNSAPSSLGVELYFSK